MSNDTFALTCKCGASQEGLTNGTAYRIGWRLQGNSPMCPACVEKHDAAFMQQQVKKYGRAKVQWAKDIVDELLGGHDEQ